jgi:cytoplasmic iron level regulating protein YaaA (DUF328/UPF0246 family)
MTANVDPTIVDINSGGDNFLPKKRNKTAGYNPRFAKKKALKNKKLSLNAKMHRNIDP